MENTEQEKGEARTQRTRGTGSLYRRPNSAHWQIKYYRNGKVYRESTHIVDDGTETSKRKAEKFLQKRLGEIATGNFAGPQVERIKVEQLAEDFLRDYRINGRRSIDDVEARWKLHLKPFFAHLRAVNVTTDLLNRYVDERQKQGAASATINRELAALKRMFYLGYQSTPPKVYRVPHFPHLREDNTRTGFVEDGQYSRMAQECGKVGLWMRAMFETAYNFGWRVSELMNLRVNQVDLPSLSIRLNPGETKNGQGRLVKLVEGDTLYQLLAACVSGKKPNDHVFTHEDGTPVRDFRVAWANVCCAAGLGNWLCPLCGEPVNSDWKCEGCSREWRQHDLKYQGLIFHDLRRTAVRNMVRRGIPERVAMMISGHKTRSVFDRYNIVSESDLDMAARRISEATPNVPVELSEGTGHKTGHSDTFQGGAQPAQAIIYRA